jgi:hypothetical protein
MKREIIISFILFIAYSNAHAQSENDTILMVKNKYIIDGKVLRPNQMLELMKNYPDAYNSMKKAKSNYNGAMACAYIGGFCVGYPLGQALAGGDPAWVMAGIGAGLIILCIPLNNAYNTNAKAAVKLYNSQLHQTGMREIELYFGLTANGIGMTCRF